MEFCGLQIEKPTNWDLSVLLGFIEKAFEPSGRELWVSSEPILVIHVIDAEPDGVPVAPLEIV